MDIIVIAYGPNRNTGRAIRTARSAAGPTGRVLVVPAVEPGIPAATSLSGAELAPEIGSAGMAWALGEATSTAVMVFHDDVVVRRADARRMLDQSGGDGEILVAHTNDVEADHFYGSLPTGSAAESRINTLKRPQSRPIDRFRPVCFVTTPTTLATLVAGGVTDPRMLVTDPDFVVVATDVIAVHEGSCTGRLVDPAQMTGPLLVASMIVKDEEALLAGCLESIAPLVDRIEICDTGSSDRTAEIAESFGAHVTHIEWRDDFGWARNQALDQCRDAAYVLALDADERIKCADPELLRAVLATHRRDYTAMALEVESSRGSAADSASSTIRSIRIFRPRNALFVGAVHEALVDRNDASRPMEGRAFALAAVTHLGYAPEVVVARDKHRRNLTIAHRQYEEHPGFKSAIEYGRSLLAVGQDELAVKLIEEAAREVPGNRPETVAYVKGLLGTCRLNQENAEEALELAREALELVPADNTALLVACRAAEELGRPEVVLEAWEIRRGRKSRRPVYVIEHNARAARSALVWALAVTGQAEAALMEAAGLLDDDPSSLEHWPAVVAAASQLDDPVEPLVILALIDRSNLFVDPVVAQLSPIDTVLFALAFLGAGGSHAEVATAGLAASLVAESNDLVAGFAPYLELVNEDVRARLGTHLEQRGMSPLAGAVRS